MSKLSPEVRQVLNQLQTVRSFAQKMPSSRVQGKTGVSPAYIYRILESHQCNFEKIDIDGVAFIYLPPGQQPVIGNKSAA